VFILMLGKCGIGSIHFLIPLLVGILIFSISTIPEVWGAWGSYLFSYDADTGKVELSTYDVKDGKLSIENKWSTTLEKDWDDFSHFWGCGKIERYARTGYVERCDYNEVSNFLFSYKKDGSYRIDQFVKVGENLKPITSGKLIMTSLETGEKTLLNGLQIISKPDYLSEKNFVFTYDPKAGKLILLQILNEQSSSPKIFKNLLDIGTGFDDFAVFEWTPADGRHTHIVGHDNSNGNLAIVKLMYKDGLDITKPTPSFGDKAFHFKGAFDKSVDSVIALENGFEHFFIAKGGGGPIELNQYKMYLMRGVDDAPAQSWSDILKDDYDQLLKINHNQFLLYNEVTGDAKIGDTNIFGLGLGYIATGNIGSGRDNLNFYLLEYDKEKQPAGSESRAGGSVSNILDGICIAGTKSVGNSCVLDLDSIFQEPFFQCFKGDLTLVGDKFLCVTDLIEKLFSTTDFSPPISYSAFTTDFSPPISYSAFTTDFSPPISYSAFTTDFSPPISYVEATTDFSPPIQNVVLDPCPEGFDYNIVEGNCETTPKSDCNAFPGTTKNLGGDCEIGTIKKCPSNMSPIADNPLVCSSLVSCPSDDNTTLDGNCERAKKCPSGTSVNTFGDCESGTTNADCHEWNYFLGAQTTCKNMHYHCPSGTSWNGAACIGSTSCPSGYTKGAFVCYKSASCPSGATKTANLCTSDVILSCPSGSGTSLQGLFCIASPQKSCPPPSVLTQPLVGNPICVTESNLACPLGFAPLVEDFGQFDFAKCFSLPKLECPDGLELIGDICKGTPTDCPTGFTKNAFGDCESPLFCNIGLVPDPKTGLCMWPPIDEPKLPDDEPELGNGLKVPDVVIPSWVKDIAGYWCADEIGSSDFVQVIEWMIKEGLIMVPQDSVTTQTSTSSGVPDWIQFNACIWDQGEIGDKEFSTTLQWLIDNGIIKI